MLASVAYVPEAGVHDTLQAELATLSQYRYATRSALKPYAPTAAGSAGWGLVGGTVAHMPATQGVLKYRQGQGGYECPDQAPFVRALSTYDS